MIRISGCNGYNKRFRGMTLIEILIAVVIIGIIAAIAYPSYTNHTITAHRTVALSDISRIQLELETSYNGGYDWSSIISGGTCTICDSDSNRFSFNIASTSSAAYVIEATAKADLGQNGDNCFPSGVNKITLTSTNIESPSACWD
ncbi:MULTISPECIES: type IV pilin protein [Vibrio]|jgi:type IV pilus assembly protein PilE|uniref:Prepilin-type N-terminal cleavage/methylation domain-containing protein n=2 Tax=Vibrio harveyi TaxID=669 RepID=A0A8B3DKH3_VIBHA|nr:MULTISPECIES: type IV pilin protein [Vibrio]AWA98331.1 prepilin-type cleavage/methylation domain-containing protein [Vibrio harveyi]EKO3800448.1 type IV pilin protein [Vibrio harveyi]EKO3802733.1 type IV pilin protein [Vibrio harveyi]EKO3814383.1 type IV pilin protein [Vibrio harveyi]EKO3818368.1 type IV pilin protein [Vibrio harveyi]